MPLLSSHLGLQYNFLGLPDQDLSNQVMALRGVVWGISSRSKFLGLSDQESSYYIIVLQGMVWRIGFQYDFFGLSDQQS